MIDGDGCLCQYKSGGVSINLVSGSAGLLGQFEQFAKALVPCIRANVTKHKGIFRFIVSGSAAVELIKILYLKCPVGLDRKVKKRIAYYLPNKLISYPLYPWVFELILLVAQVC
jgi:hypothetical protein